jgi:hypothetical protein
MRLQALAILLVAFSAFLPTTSGHNDGGDLVNAVLGNSSPRFASESDRIRAHLEAVADRISRADVSSLDPALRDARRVNIERLRAYARAGTFPNKPASIPGRIPNFLDDRGNVCAVGYLVEQDLGRPAVAAIAREHQFDYVPYIDSPVLATWQATSGLSPLELAMIQPNYGDPDEERHYGRITDGGGYYSNEELLQIGLVTSNVVTSVANFAYLGEGRGSAIGGWLGIMSGGASMLYGLSNDNPAITAAGAMAGAFGIVSFGLGVGRDRDNDQPARISVNPAALPDADETAIGVVAQLRF